MRIASFKSENNEVGELCLERILNWMEAKEWADIIV
jgi:hypothetical protein